MATFRVAAIAALVGLTFSSVPAVAAGMVDKHLDGKYFLFSGVNVRINSITTVAKVDPSSPLLKDINTQGSDLGYVAIQMNVQNPSSGDDISIPSLLFGFELADGSQKDEEAPGACYIGTSLASFPPSLTVTLHPKQNMVITCVSTNWNGTALTKMFLKSNGGGNDKGALYVRFQIPKDYVKAT